MKRFKARKRVKKHKLIKLIILTLLMYLSFSYSVKYLYNSKLKNRVNNEVLINYLLKSSSNNLTDDSSLFELDLNASNLLLKTGLNNMLADNLITTDDYLDSSNVTSYFEDPNNYTVNSPIIYIYNTHQLEEYSNSNIAMYDASANVLMASYILKEYLNDLNLPTIVEQTDITSLLNANGWSYSYSYKASASLVKDALEQNTTLTYLIDLHRDSSSYDRTTLIVDDKTYAKVLFVVGLEHDNYEPNLLLAQKLSDMLNEKVNNLSKGVLQKQGEGVNGIYNQDLSENSVLIEVGGPDNTIDEVSNTLKVIADVYYDLIVGER